MPKCPHLVPRGKKRCPQHEREWLASQKGKDAARLEREPWRIFYRTVRWARLCGRVKRRDGHRCRFRHNGKRCPVTEGLEVHHKDAPADAFERGGLAEAKRVFYDDDNCVTACRTHNLQADAERRRRKRDDDGDARVAVRD